MQVEATMQDDRQTIQQSHQARCNKNPTEIALIEASPIPTKLQYTEVLCTLSSIKFVIGRTLLEIYNKPCSRDMTKQPL